jgi:hypothetical protein
MRLPLIGTPAPIRASAEFDAVAAGAQFRDVIARRVTADPDALFRALREVTLADMTIARIVGDIRYLPTRLIGRLPRADPHKPFLSLLIEGGTLVLRDHAPDEIITGSAGRLHRIFDQAPVRFDSLAAFDAFDDPDYEKLFMSIRVTAGAAGRWLVLEHATHALSPIAEKKFRRYWRVIKPGGAFVTGQLLKAIDRRAATLCPPGSYALSGKDAA